MDIGCVCFSLLFGLSLLSIFFRHFSDFSNGGFFIITKKRSGTQGSGTEDRYREKIPPEVNAMKNVSDHNGGCR